MTSLTPFERESLPVLKWWTAVRENADRTLAETAYALALLLSVWLFLTQRYQWGTPGIVIAAALLLLTLATQFFAYRCRSKKTRRIVALEQKVEKLKASAANGAEQGRSVITEKAQSLLAELNLLNDHCRMTVYQHEPARATFVSIGRVSHSPKLRKPGRAEYPDDQGLIAEAWTSTRATRFRLPEDPDEWAAEVSLTGIPEDEALMIQMKSRSYVGVRLDYGMRKVGVLMLEGLKPQSVNSTHADDIQKHAAYNELAAMLAVTPKLPPHETPAHQG